MSTLTKITNRPLQYVTPEELSAFMRTNRPFRDAWRDLAPYMRERDIRGVKRWVFAMGWLSCLAYYRRHIMTISQEISERIVKESVKLSDDFAARTGIPE